MSVDTPQVRPLAIVAGMSCVLTALLILLGPSVFRPAEWTQYHAITVAVVFVTIAFLHLRAQAWRSGHGIAATGFVLLSLVGTGLIVGQSVGRQAETATTNALSTADTNSKIAAKQVELTEAQGRLAYAESQMEREQTGQKCAERCKRWEKTAADRKIVVQSIETEIAALGPQKPVNAKAEKIADLAEVFGAPRAKAIALWTLLEPFALTLLFEFGSVLCFAYGFPHRPSVVAVVPAVKHETMIPDDAELADFRDRFIKPDDPTNVVPMIRPDDTPDGSGPKPGKRNRSRRVEVLADLDAAISKGERFYSQEQISERFGVPTSTLSDWLKGHPVNRTIEGRRKRVG